MESALAIKLLGPLEVLEGEGTVELGSSKERVLISALALLAGSIVEIDRLVSALWPEAPPMTAHKTLQGYIARLRVRLGRDAILSAPNGYGLNLAPSSVDVEQFDALVKQARSEEHDVETRIALLESALALWRGPIPCEWDRPLLHSERLRLEEARETARTHWLELRLGAGRDGELICELEEAVDLQPMNEHRWGLLIMALYRAGRQAEALRAYARVRSILRGVGLEPGPELARLERAVLEQRPELEATGDDGHNGLLPLPAGLLRHDRGLIVGRSDELTRLMMKWCRVIRGEAEVVAVTGEPGIGKSALVARFAAHTAGASVLYGRCDPADNNPYSPLAEAIEHAALHAPIAVLKSLDHWRLAGLEALVPAIRHRLVNPALPLPTGQQLRLDHVADAIEALLRSLAARGPVILILEDMHHASDPSLALVRRLLRDGLHRLLLVVVYRDTEPGDVNAALTDLLADRGAGLLTLTGLDREGVSALADAVFGNVPPATRDDVVDSVLAESAGNPSHVWGVLRARHASAARGVERVGG